MKRVVLFVAEAAVCVPGYLFLMSDTKGSAAGVGVVLPALLLAVAMAGLNWLFFRREGESLAAIGWDAPSRRLRQLRQRPPGAAPSSRPGASSCGSSPPLDGIPTSDGTAKAPSSGWRSASSTMRRRSLPIEATSCGSSHTGSDPPPRSCRRRHSSPWCTCRRVCHSRARPRSCSRRPFSFRCWFSAGEACRSSSAFPRTSPRRSSVSGSVP